MQSFYSLDLYWRGRQVLKGFPTIETRAERYRNDGRLDRWLDVIKRFGPEDGRVIEVGCAPGVLLEELASRDYECIGVEASADVAEWIRLKTGLDVRAGFFPGVPLDPCDLFLSFDVLEHSSQPQRFLQEAASHLKPGGVAIIQTAIERYGFDPPFGSRFDLFDDAEHLFLFTDEAIVRLAAAAGLRVVSLEESVFVGGEIVVLARQ